MYQLWKLLIRTKSSLCPFSFSLQFLKFWKENFMYFWTIIGFENEKNVNFTKYYGNFFSIIKTKSSPSKNFHLLYHFSNFEKIFLYILEIYLVSKIKRSLISQNILEIFFPLSEPKVFYLCPFSSSLPFLKF